jgi:hypothetical protein
MIGQRGLFTLVLGENTVDDYANMQAQMTMGMQGDAGKAFTMERENLDLVRSPATLSTYKELQARLLPQLDFAPTAAMWGEDCERTCGDQSHVGEYSCGLLTP